MDDPRNTDNAWMETVAVNFHDDTGEIFSEFKLQVSQKAISKSDRGEAFAMQMSKRGGEWAK